MTRIQVSRDIAAPAEAVFRAVADVGNLPKTSDDVIAVRFLSDRTSGVGTRFVETRRMGKKEMETELEITEYTENQHARMVTDSHGTIWDTTFDVMPTPKGTSLDIVMDARPHTLLTKILTPIFKGMFRKGMVKHIDALAEYCEKEAKQD